MRWPRFLAWTDKGIPLSPVARLRVAWITLFASTVGMLLSLVFVTGEPRLVLALSWGALILTAADILSTTDVRAKQE